VSSLAATMKYFIAMYTLIVELSGLFSSQAINPCNDDTHGCHSYADCFYLGPGKNNCTCAAGYRGDGVVCLG